MNAPRDKASSERDPACRGQFVTEIQAKLLDLKPAASPLFERFEPIVPSDKVKDYTSNIWPLTRVDGVSKAN